VDNQSQIAKRLVGLLDHDDAGVVQRAAHDLQALAKDLGVKSDSRSGIRRYSK